MLGPPNDPIRFDLSREGFSLRSELAQGVAAIVLIVAHDGLPQRCASRLRASLGPRGRVIAHCASSQLVGLWLALRRAGLEPKRTLVMGEHEPQAVVLARPAKRGGLSIELAPAE